MFNLALVYVTCFIGSSEVSPTFSETEWAVLRSLSPAVYLHDSTNKYELDEHAALLGQMIFFDPRFSSNGEVSCATCHEPELYFTDELEIAIGTGTTTRNSPTVLNAAHQRWFFWDGRTDTLWGQPIQTMEHPAEMDASRVGIARIINNDPKLRMAWEKTFSPLPLLEDSSRFPLEAKPIPRDPDALQNRAWEAMSVEDRDAIDEVMANVAKALAAYVTKLDASDAPFDAFVAGDTNAISPSAQRGLKYFITDGGCLRCHFSPWFSDGAFHTVGIPPLDGGPLLDAGRAAAIVKLQTAQFTAGSSSSDDPTSSRAIITKHIVKRREDWGAFRTPSLRNVEMTPPYMHAGQMSTLEDVLEHYSKLENFVSADHHRETILQPLELTDEQKKDLIAFLSSLTAPLPNESLLKAPE